MTYYKKKKFKNPIIAGFYPDPSICRVGDDYYLVNSTFEYFPAIPVWHSKDLVHWEQISNAIDREEQELGLDRVNLSGGVQACTIRYYNGVFYITSTSVGKEWPRLDYNFIITATDPRGPWSKVHYIQNAPGIDSSLFFDDDGKAYFHANQQKDIADDKSDAEIWVQEIDLDTFELIGEKHVLWDGCGGIYPEGPHIYKKNGYYYLLIAEGGTGHWHTVTMARSKNIFGPYESNPRNPLLTHKNLDIRYPIQNVGHADIIETQNGEWYMVCLGSRPKGKYDDLRKVPYSCGGYYANLGRETFLVPMVWEDDFGPIVSPETGKVEEEYTVPDLPEYKVSVQSCSHFESDELELFWNTIRNEKKDFYSLSDRKGYLRLKMLPGNIVADDKVSFLARRQTSWYFTASTKMELKLHENAEQAGICSYFNYKANMRLFLEKENDKTYLKLIKRFKEQDTLINKIEIASNCIYLKIDGNEQEYTFYYGYKSNQWIEFGTITDGEILSSYASEGHTGTYVGIFASSDGKISDNYADFGYFEYVNLC
ncbi:MAG: glycoside hydrolase family 43 protein [Vallitalea sp.]|jgi:alpha-N-arabinofuranosidase|nr:glycoside hydrolase family 43 protein [Vallitalea sp.]